MTDRLYRSQTDRVIAGVAGGLAAWLRIDPSIVRVGWVVLAVLTGGIFLLVYIVMMIVVPLAPDGWVPSPGPPPGGSWGPPADAGRGARRRTRGQWGSRAAERRPVERGASRARRRPGSGRRRRAGPDPRGKGPDTTNVGIVGGFVLVGIGVWFLVDQYVHIDWQLVWPVVVILIGVGLIVAAMRRSRPSA